MHDTQMPGKWIRQTELGPIDSSLFRFAGLGLFPEFIYLVGLFSKSGLCGSNKRDE